jgi:hypothetical protein
MWGAKMIRDIKRTCLLAGLAAFGAMFAGGSEARAASVGFKGTIAPLPGGSPFLYTFDVYLTSGTISPGSPSNPTEFTISGLVGVSQPGFLGVNDPGSPTYEPPGTGNPFGSNVYYTWIVNTGGIVTTGSPVNSNYESSVTWQYTLGPTLTWSGTNIFLGSFEVETTAIYNDNAPPVTPGITPIGFSYSLPQSSGGPSTGGGTFTVTSVPEPSSVILLVIGGGVLPLVFRKRASS